MNDRDFIRGSVGEQRVQRPGDDDIEVEEEAKTVQRKVVAEKAEFAPSGAGFFWGKIDRWNRMGFDRFVQALIVVRETNEANRRR